MVAHLIRADALEVCQVSVGVLAGIDLRGVRHVWLVACAKINKHVRLGSGTPGTKGHACACMLKLCICTGCRIVHMHASNAACKALTLEDLLAGGLRAHLAGNLHVAQPLHISDSLVGWQGPVALHLRCTCCLCLLCLVWHLHSTVAAHAVIKPCDGM